MTIKRPTRQSFEELERRARHPSDIRPLSASLRREWDAARQIGKKKARGRPRKDPRLKSRIVPISIDPKLLAEIDKYAKSAGLTRSRLIAEGLRLRMRS